MHVMGHNPGLLRGSAYQSRVLNQPKEAGDKGHTLSTAIYLIVRSSDF